MTYPRARNLSRAGRPWLSSFNPTGRQQFWNGPTNRYGNPTIRGVSALDSARIMQDSNMGSLGGKKSSKQIAEEENDRESANQVKRSVAFEKGYENYRRSMGMGAPTGDKTPMATAAPKADANEARRQRLIAGGLSPREADIGVQQEKAKPAAKGPSVPAPISAIGSLASAVENARKAMNPGEDSNDPALARRLAATGASNAIVRDKEQPAVPQDLTQNQGTPALESDDEPEPRMGGGPVEAVSQIEPTVKKAAVYDGRTGVMTQAPGAFTPQEIANGAGSFGPRTIKGGGVTVNGGGRPSMSVSVMKHGGKAKAKSTYKVGDGGTAAKPKPEVFMPNSGKPPSVIGKTGPQVGQFPEPGVVIPHKALQQMKQKFSKVQPNDADGDEMPRAKGGKVAKAMMAMRPC